MKSGARAEARRGPLARLMLATRLFYNYFTVEIIFGINDHFGKETRQ